MSGVRRCPSAQLSTLRTACPSDIEISSVWCISCSNQAVLICLYAPLSHHPSICRIALYFLFKPKQVTTVRIQERNFNDSIKAFLICVAASSGRRSHSNIGDPTSLWHSVPFSSRFLYSQCKTFVACASTCVPSQFCARSISLHGVVS